MCVYNQLHLLISLLTRSSSRASGSKAGGCRGLSQTLNGLSESLSLDSQFVLDLRYDCLKLHFFMSIFQGIIVLNGLSNALLLPKAKKLQFVQSFSSFKKEIKKKEQIHFFFWLIVNPFSPSCRWQQSPLPCTHLSRACRKWCCFEKN